MRDINHHKDKEVSGKYKGGFHFSKKLLFIIIGVIVVIGLGVGVYFLIPSIKSFDMSSLFNIFMRFVPTAETNESKAAVVTIVSGYDGVNINTLNLDALTAVGKFAVPTLVKMLDSNNSNERYAAVVGLSAVGHNSSVSVLSYLKDAMTDTDVNVRVTAAELAMSFGSKDGIPVLIAELENTAILKPSEPVMQINSHCAMVLQAYTNQTFGVDKAQWNAWWDNNKNNLKWNKTNGKFTI